MIENIPEIVKDFIQTMEPLKIKIEMKFQDFDGRIKYLCFRSLKRGFNLFDEKMELVGRKRLNAIKYQDLQIGISYSILVAYWPEKRQDALETIDSKVAELQNAIEELKIVKQWLEKYPEIALLKKEETK